MQDQIDWEAVERSPEFQELIRARRRFIVPRVIFFLGWYIAFILLAGYAESFMGERIHEGLTVGYVLALSQFVMVWFLAWEYLRKANKVFEPLEEAVARKFGPDGTHATGRFKRKDAPATEHQQVKR